MQEPARCHEFEVSGGGARVVDAIHAAVHAIVVVITAFIIVDRRLFAGNAVHEAHRELNRSAFQRGIVDIGEERIQLGQILEIKSYLCLHCTAVVVANSDVLRLCGSTHQQHGKNQAAHIK